MQKVEFQMLGIQFEMNKRDILVLIPHQPECIIHLRQTHLIYVILHVTSAFQVEHNDMVDFQ